MRDENEYVDPCCLLRAACGEWRVVVGRWSLVVLLRCQLSSAGVSRKHRPASSSSNSISSIRIRSTAAQHSTAQHALEHNTSSFTTNKEHSLSLERHAPARLQCSHKQPCTSESVVWLLRASSSLTSSVRQRTWESRRLATGWQITATARAVNARPTRSAHPRAILLTHHRPPLCSAVQCRDGRRRESSRRSVRWSRPHITRRAAAARMPLPPPLRRHPSLTTPSPRTAIRPTHRTRPTLSSLLTRILTPLTRSCPPPPSCIPWPLTRPG